MSLAKRFFGKRRSKKQPGPRPRSRQQAKAAGRKGVFSYYASGAVNRQNQSSAEKAFAGTVKDDSQSPTPKKQRTLGRLLGLKRLATRGLVLVVLIAILGSTLLLSSTPRIVMLDPVQGVKSLAVRNATEYEKSAQSILAASAFNHTKLTINIGSVSRQLQEHFPELADVSVSLPLFGRQPVVYLQPAAAQLVLSTDTSGQFVVDSSGRSVATGKVATDLAKAGLPVVQDQNGIPVQLGQTVLSKNDVSFITEVARQLRAKNTIITALVLPVGSSSELHLKFEGVDYVAKFNLRGQAREAVGSLLVAKQQLESEGIVPAEYIDVRVKGKVYVK